jgi:hypothetical protein
MLKGFSKNIANAAVNIVNQQKAASQPKEVFSSDTQVDRRSIAINNSGVRYNSNPMVDVNAEKWKGLI